MSPKEKATEIINECAVIVYNCGSPYPKEHTKECALMVVNQILKNDCGYNAYDGTIGNEYWMDTEFWDDVKLEIEGSKLAEMMANAHEGEKYNHLTKEWEKI